MKLAVTGHRPNKIFKDDPYSSENVHLLTAFAAAQLRDYSDLSMVITGMALGWDQAIAQACLALDIPFTAAIPFTGQESRWPPASQRAYRMLLSKAAAQVIISPNTPYHPRLMQVRNEWCCNECDSLLALWDGSAGGTGNCVEYFRAHHHQRVFKNIWSEWLQWRKQDA